MMSGSMVEFESFFMSIIEEYSYQYGEGDDDEDWDLQGNWQIFQEGSEKLTDSLT